MSSPRGRASRTPRASDQGPGAPPPRTVTVARIVSGGQTGADRAALDVALELGIPCGGWCPRGRRAEDGAIDARYPLAETPSRGYAQRTEWNVRDADATLVLAPPPLRGGTALTVRLAARHARPCLVVDPATGERAGEVRAWLVANRVGTLNVAGPRASTDPTIRARAGAFLRVVLGAPLARD